MDSHLSTEDLTVIIPFKIDSADRVRNLQASVGFLLKFSQCQIIIKCVDQEELRVLAPHPRIKYIFELSKDPSIFHRTKILNEMLALVETPFVANYDCDILVPQDSMEYAMKMLCSGYDMVFPYDKGKFLMSFDVNKSHTDFYLDQPDTERFSNFLKNAELSVEHDGIPHFKTLGLGTIRTAGGVQLFRTSSYRDGGGENERFIDWGPEDQERLFRFHMLGYKIGWAINCNVCHMNHQITNSAKEDSPTYQKNHVLWEKMCETIHTREDMLADMQGWNR